MECLGRSKRYNRKCHRIVQNNQYCWQHEPKAVTSVARTSNVTKPTLEHILICEADNIERRNHLIKLYYPILPTISESSENNRVLLYLYFEKDIA